MKISVFGAGAIGSFIAGVLARAGYDPALIARGATLSALRERGLTVEIGDDVFTVPLRATDDAAALGPQDVVILATKAHQIAGALDTIAPLIGPETVIVPAINGIPWWYCKGLSGPLKGLNLKSCDPAGRIDAALPVSQVIGAVVYMATSIPEPGRVVSVGPLKMILGAPVPDTAPRVQAIADALAASGLEAPVSDDIRADAWAKLWGNVHANPLSVATQATMIEMLSDPGVTGVSRMIMQEAAEVAGKLGIFFPMSIDQRLEEASKLGTFRTSMLQDFDAGKPIELDAILGVVAELGRHLGVETPTIDALYAVVRLRAELTGCYVTPA